MVGYNKGVITDPLIAALKTCLCFIHFVYIIVVHTRLRVHLSLQTYIFAVCLVHICDDC